MPNDFLSKHPLQGRGPQFPEAVQCLLPQRSQGGSAGLRSVNLSAFSSPIQIPKVVKDRPIFGASQLTAVALSPCTAREMPETPSVWLKFLMETKVLIAQDGEFESLTILEAMTRES